MKIKINYKQLSLKLFIICLKYTILIGGFMTTLYFWNVNLKQIGFWNFILGACVYGFANGISSKIKYEGEEEE